MRRRILLVVVAMLAVVGTSTTVWLTQRQVRVVVDPACPALLTHTNNAAQDFADVVTWAGRTYVREDQGPDVAGGDELGVVSCSIGEMDNPKGWQVAPGPWPDGTATRLPRGTSLLPAGERMLVAVEPDTVTVYCLQGDQGEARCVR